MTRINLRPLQAQLDWRCSCGANARATLQEKQVQPLLDILNIGHEGDGHNVVVKIQRPEEETREAA